jgi:hypothetical protein
MIWFNCARCGKRHGRPESAIGSVIFCVCGHGNRVPWESTAPEPDPAEEPAVLPVQPPPLGAVPVGEEVLPPVRSLRRDRGSRRDPDHCFNHGDVRSELACAACEERFCARCVVQVKGETLCGPCKNYYFRTLGKPPRISGLALSAVLVALISAGLMLFLVSVLAASGANPLILLALACLPQLFAILLAALALHVIAADPRIGGQSLAITALVAGLTSSVVLGALTMMSFVHWV